jgi:hypothetical protein
MAERKPWDRHIYRRCPECSTVLLATELTRPRRPYAYGGPQWSRCPSCGHEAPTLSFLRVDPPSQTEGGEGPLAGEGGAKA